MPRLSLNQEISTFVQGLNTEANPLDFPANASLVDTNFVLRTSGKRERRLGLDFENGSTAFDTGRKPTTVSTWAVGTYKWQNADNDASLGILCVQYGKRIYFFDLYSDPITSSRTLGAGPT